MEMFGRSLNLRKKGSILDAFFIIAILLFFGIILLVGFKITSSFNTQIQGMSSMPDEAITSSSTITHQYTSTLDNIFLFLTIGLAIGALVLAALVRVHPIFIPFFFIAFIFLVVFAGILSNVYQEMAGSSIMAEEAAQLTFVSNILTYLPMIIGVIGIFMMVVMYKIAQADMYG